jgi:hypothetical protein
MGNLNIITVLYNIIPLDDSLGHLAGNLMLEMMFLFQVLFNFLRPYSILALTANQYA